MTPRLLLPILAVALLAASAGTAAAESGSLLAGAVEYNGTLAAQEGLLSLLFLQGGGMDPGTPWVALEATSARAVTYSSSALEGGSEPASTGPLPLGPSQPTESSYSDVLARMSAFQPDFQMHVFSMGDDLAFTARTDEGRLTSQGPVRMADGAFGDDVPTTGSTEQHGIESSTFAQVERAGPLVVSQAGGSQAEVTVLGDLVLELRGISLQLDSQEGRASLESGTWRAPVAGAPEPTSSVASEIRYSFVRVFLTQAELTLAVDGGDPRIAWAAAAVDLAADGPITLTHSHGRLQSGDGDLVDLRDDRFVLPAGNRLAIAPQADGLRVDVSEPALGTRGTLADVPAPASAALMGAGAVLALAAAIGIGVLRRVLRAPTLAEVETAIEEGEYRKAARLAGRIVARQPTDESAVLARGIALAKAGDNEKAAHELAHHLSLREASDGSLHYVLGIAQLDLGRQEEGRAALREAVRRTPALQAEVGARLGKGFSVATPTTRETSAYA